MNEIKKKTCINFIICAVIIVVFSYGFNVLVSQMEDLGSKMEYDQKRIGELNNQMEKIVFVRRSYKDLTKKMSEISKVLISSDEDMIDFIIELEKNADKTNVDLKKQEKPSSDGTNVYFSIQVSGKFNDVMHFLAYLENSESCVDLENIKVSSNDKMLGSVVLSADLKVYFENKDK